MQLMARWATIPATLGLCALVLGAPTVARASTILFTNFGTGFSYNASVGNPVGNDGFGGDEWQGETFTASATANLNSIEIALSGTGMSNDPITVDLTASAADSPGAVLESFTIPAVSAPLLGTNNSPITLTSVLEPLLTSGDQYWITAAAPSTSAYAWNFNSTGENADHAISTDNGATWFVSLSGSFTPGAFEVDVPEPSSLLLLSTGLIACLWLKQRKT